MYTNRSKTPLTFSIGLIFLAILLFLAALLLAPAAAAEEIPTFSIVAVERDTSVTIETADFPANQTFAVTMGALGTRGIEGYAAGTFSSGSGGTLTATFDIPAEMAGANFIAIRLETAHTNPYFAYNWFANFTTGTNGEEQEDDTEDPGENGQDASSGTPGYSGIPTFLVTDVTRNQSVTIVTDNFPAGQTFTVLMGPFGGRAVNGIPVATWNSGEGGEQAISFDIPPQLQGSGRIAIRLQTGHSNPYYAYNWFYNTTTP